MALGIIVFIFSCVGIYGFYNNLYVLTYIAFGLCLFENILGRIEGTSKTMQFFFASCFLGWIIVKDFWLGIAIGVCFENVIAFIGGCLMILFWLRTTSKLPEEENSNSVNNKDVVDIIQQTINNAKIDLETGIKKEQLDEMLENGHITQENYNEVLESIKMLEMLASFDIDELKKNNISNNENCCDVEDNDNDEYDEDLEDLLTLPNTDNLGEKK